MNKKTHAFLLLLLLLFILYLCRNKIIDLVEPFGNQIIIQPDGSFNPEDTTLSVLTYDKDINSGYTQVGICSDDNSWTKGNKTCRDYSLVGSNCDDIGSDGRSALDACRVACDNCIKYEPIKRRLPSPVEDTDEPLYSQFQGSMGGLGIESDGVGTRETMNRLGKIDERLNLFTDAYENQATNIRELSETIHARLTMPSLVKNDSDWEEIGGKIDHITVGKDTIWGVNEDRVVDNVFVCGNTKDSPCQKNVAGGLGEPPWSHPTDNGYLDEIDANEREIWGLHNRSGEVTIFKRDIIGSLRADGPNWSSVDGPDLDKISVGKDWVWGIKYNLAEDNQIVYCKNSTETRCEGATDWANDETLQTGSLRQLDAGDTEVWGVDGDGKIYKRNIDGTSGSWDEILGKEEGPANFKNVSVGEGWIWAIQGWPDRRDATEVVGQVLADNKIYKCRRPCQNTGDERVTWEEAGGNSDDDETYPQHQIDAYNGEVWGVNDDGKVFKKTIGDKNIPSCSVPRDPSMGAGPGRSGIRESSVQIMKGRKDYLEKLKTDKICETDFIGTPESCDQRCDFVPGWINPGGQ